jgi:hypothetical protein
MNDPVDGFTYSMSTVLLPINYRACAQAQMEILRKAVGFQFKSYVIPLQLSGSGESSVVIPQYSQVELQVSIDPGSYLWGWTFSSNLIRAAYIQVTEACTELPLFSDYINGRNIDTENDRKVVSILPNPLLLCAPGVVNVEIYNGLDDDATSTLVLLTSAPYPPRRPDLNYPGNLAVVRS